MKTVMGLVIAMLLSACTTDEVVAYPDGGASVGALSDDHTAECCALYPDTAAINACMALPAGAECISLRCAGGGSHIAVEVCPL